MLLRHLLGEAKGSRLEAARRIGVGRATMYRWIQAPAKLDAFKPLIQSRLTEYPHSSGVRLLAEIRAAGYHGGVTQVREYVATLRPAPEPLARFETPRGSPGADRLCGVPVFRGASALP